MQVKNHVIILLDVIGYKDLVKQKECDGTENQFLYQLHTLMSSLEEYIRTRNITIDNKREIHGTIGVGKMTSFHSLLYSDNIIFFAPYSNEIEKYNLYSTIAYAVAEFLYEYPKEEIFFRGAITDGALYYDENLHFVFGSGLVRAHELESDKAVYPRIIIDRRMNKLPYLLECQEQIDDKWYIDYLNYGHLVMNYRNKGESKEKIYRYVFNHKEAIEKAIVKNKGNETVLKKYLLLASYHNRYCERHKMSRLLIPMPDNPVQHNGKNGMTKYIVKLIQRIEQHYRMQ